MRFHTPLPKVRSRPHNRETLLIQMHKGKLPWIILRRPDEPDLSIADSHLIIRHLVDSNILPSPSSSLPAASLATERAWKSLTEEAYSCCVLLRWRDPKRWPRFYDIVFSSAPFLVRWALVPVFRRKVFYNLSSSLIWVHTDEEVLSFLLEYVSAVCGALEASAKSQPDRAKPFYFLGGEGPTQVDVETFAFWANAIVCDQSTPELMKALRESDALKRYVSGLTKRWFPEYTDRFRPYLEPYL